MFLTVLIKKNPALMIDYHPRTSGCNYYNRMSLLGLKTICICVSYFFKNGFCAFLASARIPRNSAGFIDFLRKNFFNSLNSGNVQIGAPGSSVGRALDSGGRRPGFGTRAGHLVVGWDST